MKADAFLSRCQKVKKTGNGTWLACCPAHEDKHPSMAVRELEDGRILVHCFTGCDVGEILGAVGMDFDALFPDKPKSDFVPPVRRSFPAADVLEAVTAEARYVAYMAALMAGGYQIDEHDKETLLLANERISEARRLALGER